MGQEVTVLRHSQVFVLCFWARHFNLLVSLSTQEYFVLNCKREGVLEGSLVGVLEQRIS